MQKDELAKSLLHGEEKYNCAQAVMAAFSEEFDVSADEIASYRKAGGGRAEGGICGAAHAVKELLKKKDMPAEELSRKMTEAAGSVNCREIRKQRQLSCRECVALAARFVEGQIRNS